MLKLFIYILFLPLIVAWWIFKVFLFILAIIGIGEML